MRPRAAFLGLAWIALAGLLPACGGGGGGSSSGSSGSSGPSGTTGTVVSAGAPVASGGNVALPISLAVAGSDRPSAISLEVQFPDGALAYDSTAGPTAGASATAAGKQVVAALASPGHLRVVVAGLNANAIASGMLCAVPFTVNASAHGTLAVGVDRLVIAKPDGLPLAGVGGVAGTVTIP